MDEPGRSFDYSREANARRQARLGLRLTPAERLRWLESAVSGMRRWLGLARKGTPVGGRRDGPDD